MIVIVNPFAGCAVGWDWGQHIAAGYHGGTDYIMYPPRKITAAADGVVTLVLGENGFTPGKAIHLKLADGRTINYREVASPLVASGTKVTRGQAIGNPNRASRWPHIDATVNGVRVPFEPLVNSLATASDGSKPVDNVEHQEDDMPRWMTRTDGTLNTTAIYDETRWQEFNDSTPAGAAACVFIQKSFPQQPFDAGVWSYRSDAHLEMKRPLYKVDLVKNTLTPIDYGAGGSVALPTDYAKATDVAASQKFVTDAIASLKFPTKITGTLA